MNRILETTKRPSQAVSGPTQCIGRTVVLLGGLVGMLLCAPASASHNDSTPIGLRITVTSVNPLTGTVDFDVTVVDSQIYSSGSPSQNRPFTDILIGKRFTRDRFTFYSYSQYVWEATNVILPPAIDFGDGSTIPFTRLPLVGGDPTSNPGTFRGSFSHAYGAPGVYQITAFVSGDRGNPNSDITAGNPVGGTMVAENLAGTTTLVASPETSSFRGLTAATFVTITNIGTSVPTLSRVGLLALGLGLVVLGMLLVRRLA